MGGAPDTHAGDRTRTAAERTTRRHTREANLLGLAPLLMFLVMTTRNVDLSLEEFYSFMFLFLIIKVLLYRMDNPKDAVFRIGEYRLWTAGPQIVAGVFIGLGATSLLFFIGTFRALADPIGEFLTQAVFVAFVETLLMVVLVQTVWIAVPVRVKSRWHGVPARFEWRELPIGILLWPFVFAFLHPPVRLAWLAGDFTLASFLAFAYGFFWALLFYAVFRLRDAGGPYMLFFGAVTVWTAHIAANLVILTFPATVGPFTFFPMGVGAMPEAAFYVLSGAAPILITIGFVLLLLPFTPLWRPLCSLSRLMFRRMPT